MSEARFNRQILMFGEDGQRILEAQRVSVVGLGGIGSHVAQGLAYAGIRDLRFIDDDRIDGTSLNRVVGATPEDIGRFKVHVARDRVLVILPPALVVAEPLNLRTPRAFDLLTSSTVIFGCVDHDGPRLVLTELAAAYRIPLIDVASEIFPAAEGQPFDFGGRIVVARPGDYCLFCAKQIDPEQAKAELESAEVRALRRKHGYGLGSNTAAPSVCALNGIVANLALIEFIALVTGLRAPERRLTYKGMRGVVTATSDRGAEDCYTCKCLCGQRQNANLSRFFQPEQNNTKLAYACSASS